MKYILFVFLTILSFKLMDCGLHGLKHVTLSDGTCAVIVGQNLRKLETEFRTYKLTSHCIVGQVYFDVTNNYIKVCHVGSDMTLYCTRYKGNIADAALPISLYSCQFDKHDKLDVVFRDSYKYDIYCNSSRVLCTIDKVGPSFNMNKSTTNDYCPLFDRYSYGYANYGNCSYCEDPVSVEGGNTVCRLDAGYYVSKNELYQIPDYDFVFEADELLQTYSKIIILRYQKVQNVCSIAAYYAYDVTPFYYFDIVVWKNGSFDYYCFEDTTGISFGIVTVEKKDFVFGCFLTQDWKLQCGIFKDNNFVFNVEVVLDTAGCQCAQNNDCVVHCRRVPKQENIVFLCTPDKNSCCQYNVSLTLSTNFQKLANLKMSEETDRYPGFYRKVGNMTHSSGTATYFFTNWDGFLEIQFNNQPYVLPRFYGFSYQTDEEDENICSIQYRTNNRTLVDAPVPCIPKCSFEDAPRLIHLTKLDGVVFLEICFYVESRHLIKCFDHYTNSSSLYGLNDCDVYMETGYTYLYGKGQNLYFGGEHASCVIERSDNGGYSVKFGKGYTRKQDEDSFSFLIEDVFDETIDAEMAIRDLTRLNASQFDFVAGKKLIQVGQSTFYFDEIEQDYTLLAEGFDFAFKLSKSTEIFFIPSLDSADPESSLPLSDCDDFFIFDAEMFYTVVAVDVLLLLVFVTVFLVEIKGYRRMEYYRIRLECIARKRRAVEGVNRVLV